MDMGDNENFDFEERTEDPMNFHPTNISSDWQFGTFGSTNFTNTSMGHVPMGNVMAVSSCSAAADSYVPTIWDIPTSAQNSRYCDFNVQNNASTSNMVGIRKGCPTSLRSGIDRTLDMGWNPPSSMLKGDIFLPSVPSMLPQSLSQFPADTAFIERAARYSCFNGGNFSDMLNPFGIPDSMGLYSRGGGTMQGPQEIFTGSGMKSVSCGQFQMNEINVAETSNDVSMSVEHGGTKRSPLKNERKSEGFVRSHYEAKQGAGGSGNEADEAEYSSSVGQDEQSILEGTGGEPSAKGSKKRKRSGQDTEPDQAQGTPQQSTEAAKDNSEIQQKEGHNPPSTVNKTAGKHGKQGSQASDPQKEEYIHVRARRGQATNSHSLAERVRREKISERMKFLQDLVPGCSKVTGKAVMLDEIINYVQSLQRQVEFLSMKLATVNPRLDFNIEGLLAKDILQSRVSRSSVLGISPDMPMPFPPLHPSQAGLIQGGHPSMGSSSDIIRRTINSQLAPMNGVFKEPTQLPNTWDDELHNVVQLSFSVSPNPIGEDVNGSLPSGRMKVEL